ncbi:hypothetical protein [Nocardiopsis synnemataformans]|uniref:hypothetical protein n=1 Tax=Nocardiopsis synnemataformans TaxID=61305 RepID=UPI003EB834BA
MASQSFPHRITGAWTGDGDVHAARTQASEPSRLHTACQRRAWRVALRRPAYTPVTCPRCHQALKG